MKIEYVDVISKKNKAYRVLLLNVQITKHKIFVSRIYGQFKLERDINEQVHTLINQFKVPVY